MKKSLPFLFTIIFLFGCASNPLTGKNTMALIPNSQLFPMASAQYGEFLQENKVIKGTGEADMLHRVGVRLVEAARKWVAAEGSPDYLNDYSWEFNLIDDNTINAWVMPGGKVVFYKGILPLTQTEAGIAVVMGHEIAHALLNHGQQRMSAGLIQEIGAMAVGLSMGIAGLSPESQDLFMLAYGLGTTLGGTLPFSRKNEFEADKYGTILMAIAGYNPDEAPIFWERMMALSGGGGTPQFLSTHPSDANRIKELNKMIPEAKQKATEFGVRF